MIDKSKMTRTFKRILRIGVFGTFLGHGFVALSIKKTWIPLLTAFSFSKETAITLLPLIGTLDIIVAFLALVWPIRIVLIWASLWAFATALSRPIAGEHICEFAERTANWAAPLALLAIHGFPKKLKDLFTMT
jgi:hypothetical protein